MSHNNLTYEDWKATIESDPDRFVALAEETGLADRIRAAVLGSTPAPSGRMMAIMDRITDLRTELEALHNEMETLKKDFNQQAAQSKAGGDIQPVSVNDSNQMNAHGKNALTLTDMMEALDKDGPRVMAKVDKKSGEIDQIVVDPSPRTTQSLLSDTPDKRIHHYRMSQFTQLFWMTPASRFGAMDYHDWSKVAQFIRQAATETQLGEPDTACTFADTPHLMAAHPTLSPDTARERLNLLERYPSASDTQSKLELTEILMAHRHGVAPDRSLFSLESLQAIPYLELVRMTEPEAIDEEVAEKEGAINTLGDTTSLVAMRHRDVLKQEVSELKNLQQAVHVRHGLADTTYEEHEPDDAIRPM